MGDSLASHLAALTFQTDTRVLSRHAIALAIVLHLAGLAAVWRFFQQPLWLAIPMLALLLFLPAVSAWRRRQRLAIEMLAPLFFLYAVLLTRVVTIWFVRARLPFQDESTLANIRLLAFQIDLAVIAAIGYTTLVQIARFAPRIRRVAPIGLGVVSLVWFVSETIGHRTRGVTATDPYAYAQMAVDLVERGTTLHAFPLFDVVKDLAIKWYPIQHIGYRLFENAGGAAATVWSWGGSLWLAAMYCLVGETGLYIATPIAALASLLVAGVFTWEFFRARPLIERSAITAIAVALLATSWEQVDRSLVPLVDVQAQLFSSLAIYFAVRKNPSAVGAGLALGAAYWVRHTQVLLALPIALAAFQFPVRARLKFLGTTALVSLVVALPDLIFHQQNFANWLTPESHELALFSLVSIAKSTQVVADRFFAANEFGYLFPFLIYGAFSALRDNALRFGVLALWLIVLVGFHLFYEALRMRDLLPEFPVVVLLTAYGMVALIRDLRARRSMFGDTLTATVIFLALLLTLTRTQFTLMRPLQPAKVTFGYVTATQRAAFDQIGALTPRDAVIGSTMNDGAIDLYTRRATFRPGGWSADELQKFIDTMRGANRRVYLLDDGAETSAARRALAQSYSLSQITALDVPLFGVVDGTPGALYEIVAER